MSRTSASEASELITEAGGDAEFGKLLGIDGDPGYLQRVNNWKRRGLPSVVVLEHYETIQKLRRRLNGATRKAS